MPKNSHQTPAMARRSALMAAFQARGNAYSNLWLAQSILVPGGTWILTSDPEYFHFLTVESDSSVRTYVLQPPATIERVGNDDYKTQFDAIVDFADGRRECREVKAGATDDPEDLRAALQREAQLRACVHLGGAYVRIDGLALAKNSHRIWNAARMLRAVRAAEGYALPVYRNACGSRLGQAPKGLTLGELVEPYSERDHPLVLAAVFRLYFERLVRIDLDRDSVNRSTRVELAS